MRPAWFRTYSELRRRVHRAIQDLKGSNWSAKCIKLLIAEGKVAGKAAPSRRQLRRMVKASKERWRQ